jgi:hypothetical protein
LAEQDVLLRIHLDVTHAKWMIEFVFHAILVVRCQ